MKVIEVGTGIDLVFDIHEKELWIALETSGNTVAELQDATESMICATSAEDVDALIRALERAREFFG